MKLFHISWSDFFQILEFAVENLLFWESVEEYKKNYNPETCQMEAKKIWDKFLSSESFYLVNLDSELKERIFQSLENPSLQVYDELQKFIFNLMKNDSFVRWKRAMRKKFEERNDRINETN